MRAGPIVIFYVAEQQVTEVALAEHNNVVKAFPSDRTDQPFSISILPRGARRRQTTESAVDHAPQSTSRRADEMRLSVRRTDPCDAVGMIAKERPPALGWRVSSPDHVLGHARLSDIDAELEEFSMDPRRSPQRIGNAHLADKLAYLRRFGPHGAATSTASTI